MATANDLRFQTIFESVPECVKILDANRNLVDMNSAGLRMIEAESIDQVRGKCICSLIAPEYLDEFVANCRDVFEGKSNRQVFEIVGLQGTRRWMETHQVPMPGEAGKVANLLAVTRDITEHRRSVQALRNSETRSRTLLEGSPVCTKIIDLDSRLRYMSAAGQQQLKIEEVEPLYGTHFPPELYPECWHAEVGEHLERAKQGQVSSLECPVLNTEGDEIWFDTTFVPACDDEGRVQYVIVTSVNVTERRRAERMLRASELQLQTIISNAPVVIISIDRSGTITLLDGSAVDVVGLDRSQILGTNYFDLWHDRPCMLKSMRECLSGVTPQPTTMEISGRSLETRYSALRNENNEVIGAITVCVDITARKKAEEEARRHQDELAHVARVSNMGEMATGIAHELSQPLSALASYSYAAKTIVESCDAVPSEIVDVLDKIEEQAIRAGDIVRQLRGFLRKSETKKTNVNVNTLVRGVARLVDPDVKMASTPLQLQLADPSPSVFGDEVQLQQVLVNLLKNALDAMQGVPANLKSIHVSTATTDEQRVDIVVSDSGSGLSEDELPHIFDAFFSTKQDGLGMGLPISRTIVEAHGGKLWAKNNPGGGATFGFTLPRIDPE